MIEKTSIYRRILRAVGAEALGQFLNIGIRLLLVPLFLSAWGAQAYGEWLILTAVAAWFGLGDLGGQMYFVNRLTAAWAAGRRDEFQGVLATGLALFLVLPGVLLGCVVLGLMWPPFLPWLGLKAVELHVAKLVLLIMALRFLVALPVGLLLGVYRATGAQATSVMYENLMLVIQFVGSALALLAGAGMVVLASLEVLPLLVVTAFVYGNLRRRLPPDIRLSALGHANRVVLREAVSPSLHFLGLQLATAVFIQGSVIAVSRTLGPVEVAVFSSMRTVSNLVSRFVSMISRSVWPEFTRLASTGQSEKLTYLFKTVLLLGLLTGVVYLVLIQNFGEVAYQWWLNHQLPYDPIVMFLMGCLVVLTNMWTLGSNLLLATNAHEEYVRLQLPVSLFALWLCYVGAAQYGLSGAVMGLILGQSILMTGATILLLKRKGWGKSAACLLQTSAAAIPLLLMCSNLWSGLVGIVLVAGLTARQTGRRAFTGRW